MIGDVGILQPAPLILLARLSGVLESVRMETTPYETKEIPVKKMILGCTKVVSFSS